MGSLSFRGWRRSWSSALLVGGALGACAAVQVPPGPEPEYQRPEVMPWKAGVAAADPLAGIEADGEWADDSPSEGGAPGVPAPEPLRSPTPPKF